MKRKHTRRTAITAERAGEAIPVSIRLRRVHRLCVAFDCSAEAAEMIVELVDRLQALEGRHEPARHHRP